MDVGLLQLHNFWVESICIHPGLLSCLAELKLQFVIIVWWSSSAISFFSASPPVGRNHYQSYWQFWGLKDKGLECLRHQGPLWGMFLNKVTSKHVCVWRQAFPVFMILWYVLAHVSHNNSDVSVTIQPPSHYYIYYSLQYIWMSIEEYR